MELIYALFAGLAAVAAALASLAVWAPRRTWVRFTAVGLVALFLPLTYGILAELLSRPKPASFEWYERGRDKAIVLGIDFNEGEAIYLWLRVGDTPEPRYFVIPWHVKLAERLEDAMEDAVRKNAVVVIRNPFIKPGPDDWGDLNVQIMPPPLPPMKAPRVPPRIIDPREFKI